ncbi:39S ribosomal protein L34, mitochondrial [Egretta garzetta]|uniref:39S ribosomal protein L34, mitochondrial n=1 Tax=Egretta garzetta TaxID=188379 RepID=UPI00163C317A|nr:39S ribosomal protein L34, mitochondrial [Egretta garzetta]
MPTLHTACRDNFGDSQNKPLRVFLLQQAAACPFQFRTASVLSGSLELPLRSHRTFQPAGGCPGPLSSWNHQQIRTKARGNEYQPNNRKRKRTHDEDCRLPRKLSTLGDTGKVDASYLSLTSEIVEGTSVVF